jgi:hypothetical protein
MTCYSTEVELLEFELVLSKGTNWPIFKLNCDYQLVSEHLVSADTKKMIIVLNNFTNDIIFTYLNKTPKDTYIEDNRIVFDQSIKISKLWINGILIVLNTIKESFSFFPKYSVHHLLQSKTQNKSLPTLIHTTELYFNGELQFHINQPFFQWYNKMQLDSFKDLNSWIKSSHMGLGDPNKLLKLYEIIKSLEI